LDGLEAVWPALIAMRLNFGQEGFKHIPAAFIAI
jgi:hypothetical protein